MTRDEKVQKYIDSLSDEEMISRMADHIWDCWDRSSLVDATIDSIGLRSMSRSDLADEFYDWFECDIFDDEAFDDDEEDEEDDSDYTVDLSVIPLKCTCGGFGAHSDWCDLITGIHTPEVY